MHTAISEERPVGIIAGMEIEITSLIDSMEIEAAETVSGMTFYRGSLSAHPAVLVKCGMGKYRPAT